MSQEYPLIKIQDMNSGDIVLDEKNEKMVVYVNSTCSLFTKDGMQRYPKPASQYHLVQKKRFVCPLNQFFYIEEGLAAASYENRDMWYRECAMKETEPKVKKTILTVPDCQKPVAAFQSFSEAIAYKAKQDEPHWFFIYKDERDLWALTQSHVVHPDIEVVDETQSLRDKIHSLELTHQDLIHEITRLRNLDDENDDLYSMKIDLQTKLSAAEERVSDYSRVNGQLVAEVLNLRSNKTTLEAELTEKKRDIVFYKEKIGDLETDLKARDQEIEPQKNTSKLEAELAKEKSEKEQLLLEFKRLQETNLVNETSKNELSAQAASHKQMIESLKGRIAVRDQEIELLKKHVDQLNTKHESEIQGARQSIKAAKEQYEANLKAKDEAFSTLQLQATYIENHRDSLLKDLEQARINFETCEDHRRFLLEKVDEELQKVAFLNQQVQRWLLRKTSFRIS